MVDLQQATLYKGKAMTTTQQYGLNKERHLQWLRKHKYNRNSDLLQELWVQACIGTCVGLSENPPLLGELNKLPLDQDGGCEQTVLDKIFSELYNEI